MLSPGVTAVAVRPRRPVHDADEPKQERRPVCPSVDDDPEGAVRDAARADDVAECVAELVDVLRAHELGIVGGQHRADGVLHVGGRAGPGWPAGQLLADDAGAGHGREVGGVLRRASFREGVAAVDDDAGTQDEGRERHGEERDGLSMLAGAVGRGHAHLLVVFQLVDDHAGRAGEADRSR